MAKQHVTRLTQVNENLWRSHRPYSLTSLARLKFSVVISLQSGFQNAISETQYEYETEYAKDWGIIFINLKWSNVFPPTPKQLQELADLLDKYKHMKVLIHCKSGVDRTGVAAMLDRMRNQGWTFEQAYKEWVECGRHWWFDWWKYFLRRRLNDKSLILST